LKWIAVEYSLLAGSNMMILTNDNAKSSYTNMKQKLNVSLFLMRVDVAVRVKPQQYFRECHYTDMWWRFSSVFFARKIMGLCINANFYVHLSARI
jgi:hypothetical protein